MISEFLNLSMLAIDKGVMKKLVFSRPYGASYEKITARLCIHRERKIIAFEYSLPQGTVAQKNFAAENIRDELKALIPCYKQINLLTTVSDAELKVNKKGQAVILGGDRLSRKLLCESSVFEEAFDRLEHEKKHILSGSEDFLVALGISSAEGRVHDKRQAKFRQINKFLEYVEDIYKELPGGDNELVIYDLCCGKSYLSFAVYYYLTKVKGRRVFMPSVDIKKDVIEFCKGIAEKLSYTGMEFIAQDITRLEGLPKPDMVISLHACDTATDIVLSTAVKLSARIILSTPCCHKNLSDKIDCESLSFVTKYPKLKGKLCEAITDALRLELLSAHGYDVLATELVDPENTPKNTLIRAIKTGSFSEKKMEEYKLHLSFLMKDGKDYLPNL